MMAMLGAGVSPGDSVLLLGVKKSVGDRKVVMAAEVQ